MQKIYLDYAATTPVDPEVLKAMKPYFSDKFGNPGSLHYAGQEAISALDYSRETIARSIGAGFREIIFTSSATEANNLALKGVISNFEFLISNEAQNSKVSNIKSLKIDSKFKIQNSKLKPRIIVSAIEHESILETARDLERQGIEVVYLPVDKKGFVNLEKLGDALNENTVLVSIMYANNETGVIQPIDKISKIVADFRNSHPYPIFHTDASQAFQYLDCAVNSLGVDLMTLSSHKIYGPKGVGALYVRGDAAVPPSLKLLRANGKLTLNPNGAARGFGLNALLTGGLQEFGLRSGTENIPGVVGFAEAVQIVNSQKALANSRTKELRDYLLSGLKRIYPKAQLNGDPIKRLPNILNIYLPGVNAEEMLIKLDLAGIAVSTGSACKARALDSSHTLVAMGFKEPRAKNSLRFSLGRPTIKADIDIVLKTLKNIS